MSTDSYSLRSILESNEKFAKCGPYVTKGDDKIETALVQSVDGVFSCNLLVLVLSKSCCQEGLQR